MDELGFFEKRGLRKLVEQAQGQGWKPEAAVNLGEALSYAQDHVFSRASVAPEHELCTAALVKGCGQIRLPELKAVLAHSPDFVRVGREISTRKILEAERQLLRSVNAGVDAVQPMARRFEAPFWLSVDQQAALRHVATSMDRVTGLRGLAGTGKTTTLKELRSLCTQAGHEGVFLAPTTGAVDVLRQDGFREAMTLAKLLADPAAQAKLGPQSVLVLDEAGAVGTADMQRLLDVAAGSGARVILSGDTGQHAAVAQGDALRLIEEHSKYQFATLGEIRRQTKESYRQAVKLAATQDTAGAFELLRKDGAIFESLNDEGQLHREAATAYLRATREGSSALLIAPTWEEISGVTKELRLQLKERGELGENETLVRTFDSLSWTDAQKGRVEHFEPGQLVRFVRKTEHFKAGEVAEALGTKGKTVSLRGSGGKTVAFHPSRSPASFDVGEARELPVAAGDWLLLQANETGFTNGERVQVASIGQDGTGGLVLKDGRTLPASYRAFTHGYAVTSHSSQGKTVDEAIYVATSKSFAAVSREGFYVGISRAREHVTVFTDDAQTLQKRVQDAHTRKAAIELDGLKEELRKHGLLKESPAKTGQGQQATPEGQRAERARQAERARPSRALRPMRLQRLAPIVAVQRWAKELRAWLGERLERGQERARAVVGQDQERGQVRTQATGKTVGQDLAQRQKDLLQRLRAAPSVRQERSQSQGHGHGHGL